MGPPVAYPQDLARHDLALMEKLAEQCHQNLVRGGEVNDVSWRRGLGPGFARFGALLCSAMEASVVILW
jgi:hypothetical protein